MYIYSTYINTLHFVNFIGITWIGAMEIGRGTLPENASLNGARLISLYLDVVILRGNHRAAGSANLVGHSVNVGTQILSYATYVFYHLDYPLAPTCNILNYSYLKKVLDP